MTLEDHTVTLLQGDLAGRTLTAHLSREGRWFITLKDGKAPVLRFPIDPPDLYRFFHGILPESLVALDQAPVREYRTILEWLTIHGDRSALMGESWDVDAEWIVGEFFCKATPE